MKIKGAVLRDVRKLGIENLTLDPPKAKEVLIKIEYCGFCHSDLSHIIGNIPSPFPMLMGHEAAGVVEQVGPEVAKIKKGDRVVACWMVPCGSCPTCVSGHGNVCMGNFHALLNNTLLDGTMRLHDKSGQDVHHHILVAGFATHAVIPENGALKVPDELPLDQACFMGCCVPTGIGAAMNKANVKYGDSVAVFGLGGIGLNAVRGAALRGAYPLIAVDLEGSKEKIAREFGATHFVNASKEDPVKKIQELTAGGGVNIALECSGDSGASVQAFWSLGMLGKLVQVGIIPVQQTASLPLTFLTFHEKEVLGCLYGSLSTSYDIPKLMQAAVRGELKTDKLTSKQFKLAEINDVVAAMEKREITGRWVCKMD
jgi:S-(hydroxymethyl)glutathione dehydrogenase/alcohol dehydrogenase